MNLMNLYLNLYETMSQYDCGGYEVPEYRFVIDREHRTFSFDEKRGTDDIRFYLDNISCHGEVSTMVKAIEELSELIQQISKWLYGEGNCIAVAEEYADTVIMLNQIKIIMEDRYHGFSKLVDEIKEDKIKRQEERNRNGNADVL